MTPPLPKIIDAYCTLNHRLAIEIGQWSTMIHISSDNRLCRFYSYNVVGNEAHFVLEFSLYESIRDKFQALFENVFSSFFYEGVCILSFNWIIKSIFYLTKATAIRHSKKITSLTPSWCTFITPPMGGSCNWRASLASNIVLTIGVNSRKDRKNCKFLCKILPKNKCLPHPSLQGSPLTSWSVMWFHHII